MTLRSDNLHVYAIYRAMRHRCEKPAHRNYARYGGRGIAVCPRWHAYEAFLADMGPRPLGHVLDRIDNDGNYEPANCRWASTRESARNTSRVVRLTHAGKTQCLADWATETGIGRMTIRKRLRSGWGVAASLTRPVRDWAEIEAKKRERCL